MSIPCIITRLRSASVIIFSDQLFSGGGRVGAEKGLNEVFCDVFWMVNETKPQINEVFLQVILARIAGFYTKLDSKCRKSEIGLACVVAKRRLVDYDVVVTSKSKPW